MLWASIVMSLVVDQRELWGTGVGAAPERGRQTLKEGIGEYQRIVALYNVACLAPHTALAALSGYKKGKIWSLVAQREVN